MLDQTILYLGAHPAVLTAMGLTAVLAGVGLWYVVHHHLQAILITLLTAAGIGSGMLVLFRGFRTDTKDLMGIGLFLIVDLPGDLLAGDQAARADRARGAHRPPDALARLLPPQELRELSSGLLGLDGDGDELGDERAHALQALRRQIPLALEHELAGRAAP